MCFYHSVDLILQANPPLSRKFYKFCGCEQSAGGRSGRSDITSYLRCPTHGVHQATSEQKSTMRQIFQQARASFPCQLPDASLQSCLSRQSRVVMIQQAKLLDATSECFPVCLAYRSAEVRWRSRRHVLADNCASMTSRCCHWVLESWPRHGHFFP